MNKCSTLAGPHLMTWVSETGAGLGVKSTCNHEMRVICMAAGKGHHVNITVLLIHDFSCFASADFATRRNAA